MRVGWVALTWFVSGLGAATLFWLWLAGRADALLAGIAILALVCAVAETWLLPWAERETKRALERRRRTMR